MTRKDKKKVVFNLACTFSRWTKKWNSGDENEDDNPMMASGHPISFQH